MLSKNNLTKINDWLWEISLGYRTDMRVPARIYATEKMLGEIFRDRSLEQLINVSTLPGIQKYAIAMPDIHEGYGFPIGGVAAIDAESGIISPGGIGYDINCGVRLLVSELTAKDIESKKKDLAKTIYKEVPSGVGKGGILDLRDKEMDMVLQNGAQRMVEIGYGNPEDLKHIESEGRIEQASAMLVSSRAKARGSDQLGTMGAGNHFVEVETVEEIFDRTEADRLGIFEGQAMVLIHTGSRGLGHQIATDYIKIMLAAAKKYGIVLADKELACAPFKSPEGQNYFKAMCAGANFAWANRQLITHEVRQAWKKVFGNGGNLNILYDAAHNIAKVENYKISGKGKTVVMHRKGATRAFPGQPVIIPGSMGTGSYLLIGLEKSLEESFGSSCHGACRRMSRHQAKREISGSGLKQKLESEGVAIAAGSISGIAEEAPLAYKDINEVVDVVHNAGIAKKVARMKPLAVIKG